MRLLSEFSIKKPATTIMIVVSMIFFGVLGLLKMPVELLPNTSNPTVRITIEWRGATPEDVDKMITKKVEDILPNVDGITEYSSTSSSETSKINVKFKYGTDVETKITLIQNEINQIKNKLPNDIEEPTVREQSMGSAPAAVLTIAGGDSMEVRSYAENNLKPLLQRIQGVSQIIIHGGREQEVLVEVDPEKLENYNLGILEVSNLISKASTTIPGGQVKEGEKEFYIKVQGELKTPKEIENIILKNNNGHLLRLKDVAEVKIDTKDSSSLFRKNGEEGLVIIVAKTDEGNAVEIVESVDKVLKTIKNSLPLNSNISYDFDSTVPINNSISNVKETGVVGLFLASGILYLFLRSISATIIIATAIPISVIFTFFLLNAQGLTLNLISLMGLSLGIGMLVDNSVVVLDNIYRHMTEYGKNRIQAAKDGAAEMGLPVLASTLTTVSVFLPIVFQEGMVKEQFKDLSYSISYSLFASLIVALLFVPMLSSKILNEKKDLAAEGKVIKKLKKVYLSILRWAIKNRGIALIITILLFIGSIFAASTLGGGFIPTTDEGRFAVVAKLPSSADINMSDRVGAILEEKIKDIPVANSYTISGDTNNAILNINAGLKTSRKESLQDIMKNLRGVFKGIPDVVLTVVPSYVFGSDGIYDLEFELYSDNESQLKEISERLKEKMYSIKGITDISSSFEGGKPEGKIVVDREKAKFYGVDIESLALMIKTQILGGQPITINSDNQEIDVTVQLQKKYRTSTSLLMDSRITLDNGKSVRISDIANLVLQEGPSKIEKKDKRRKIVLYANLENGFDLQSAKTALIESFNSLGVPESISFGFGGDSSDMAEMGKQLMIIFLVAIFLIYFILVWQFESFILPFIILLSIPLSTMGALYSLAIFRVNLDAMVAVGFVMLAGIVVNNAIVLIDFINIRREAGDNINRAIFISGKTRLRPILMTTLTTVLGMIPLAISNGDGSEMYAGMSFVVIFGLSTATLFTLVIIPIFYYLVDDIKRVIKKIVRR
ncbi:efflux RND transporter permease subunit [Candidatus Cetobacterium colombiensis]|uniref:Efflux RND transporter permease subunit n=1 Tax=Candidatus Cetobacterium colombiensis TaxID=3073100 RepID=A0ABU4WAR3_9FUSO|nr:efflux RND transporter permease subunit [Candidatus Cetobacterium colombiensis]MDX8336629.1 efflux RND transporter permease subunit [Candidatus Cetobacterium colombiensis]